MSAQKEITDLMNLYCTAIDSGDLETFGRLFANATWVAEGRVPGPESMNNMILYEDGTPRTKHVITNLTLDIDEAAGTASGHCYVTVYQQTPEFPLQAIFVGEYYDTFLSRHKAGPLPGAKFVIHSLATCALILKPHQ